MSERARPVESPERSAEQQRGPSPCATCDGRGYVERAPQDSRMIHHEPCPDCGGPVPAPPPLVHALAQEYADVLARRGHWRRPWSGYYGGAQHALERVAARLGVTDLPDRAAELVVRRDEDRDAGPQH